jgi:hypothetical protein
MKKLNLIKGLALAADKITEFGAGAAKLLEAASKSLEQNSEAIVKFQSSHLKFREAMESYKENTNKGGDGKA